MKINEVFQNHPLIINVLTLFNFYLTLFNYKILDKNFAVQKKRLPL